MVTRFAFQCSYGVKVQVWAQFFFEGANTVLNPYLVFDQLLPLLWRCVAAGRFLTLEDPNAGGTHVVLFKEVINSGFFWEQELRLTKRLQKWPVQHSQLSLILPFHKRQMEFQHPEVDFEATLIEVEPKFLSIGLPLSSVNEGYIEGDKSRACCDNSESQVNPEIHH